MKRGVWSAVLLLAVVVGIVAYFLASGQDGSGTDEATVEPPADLRTELSATRVVGRHRGQRQFELDAATIADDDEWVRIEEIRNGVLYRDGRVFVTFDADAGSWHRATNDLVLTGNVSLVYEERASMHTERLEWRADDELVVAPGPVRMVIDGDVAEADAMEADLDEERVRLRGDVRIVRASGDVVQMEDVVYWLAEERLEGYGRGRIVVGGSSAAP